MKHKIPPVKKLTKTNHNIKIKTMKHPFLKYFPPLIKEVFIEEAKSNLSYVSWANSISGAFIWSRTRLGADFWSAVSNNIVYLERKKK